MTLNLKGLSVDCVIGERADERARLQRLRVDATLEVDGRAADSDDLADAVDYAALSEKIRAALVAAKCRLIERAAKIVAEACLDEGRVRSVTAEVTKSGSVPGLESASAVIVLKRDFPR